MCRGATPEMKDKCSDEEPVTKSSSSLNSGESGALRGLLASKQPRLPRRDRRPCRCRRLRIWRRCSSAGSSERRCVSLLGGALELLLALQQQVGVNGLLARVDLRSRRAPAAAPSAAASASASAAAPAPALAPARASAPAPAPAPALTPATAAAAAAPLLPLNIFLPHSSRLSRRSKLHLILRVAVAAMDHTLHSRRLPNTAPCVPRPAEIAHTKLLAPLHAQPAAWLVLDRFLLPAGASLLAAVSGGDARLPARISSIGLALTANEARDRAASGREDGVVMRNLRAPFGSAAGDLVSASLLLALLVGPVVGGVKRGRLAALDGSHERGGGCARRPACGRGALPTPIPGCDGVAPEVTVSANHPAQLSRGLRPCPSGARRR